MVTVIPFSRIVSAGTEYVTAPREVLVFDAVGTDTDGEFYFLIDRKETTRLYRPPAHYDSSKTYGSKPLPLKDLFIVVPPETPFSFVGPSGSRCLIVGRKFQLDPGEAVPEDLARRFNEQFFRFKRVYRGVVSLATNASWPAGTEYTALQVTTGANERITLNDIVTARWSNVTLSPSALVFKLMLDGRPWENVYRTGWEPGIDIFSLVTVSEFQTYGAKPFSLENLPLTVPPSTTLSVVLKNISTSALSPPSGTAISVELFFVTTYEKTVG